MSDREEEIERITVDGKVCVCLREEGGKRGEENSKREREGRE